jgi:catechol 2,3-dioxygenase-like lactoylglutathione lyase family enzyme
MIGSIEHMAIAARDTAGLAGWYRDKLGFEVVTDGGPGGIWFIGPPGGGATIEIVPASPAARVERARNDPGWSHLAFTVGDFEAVRRALTDKGIAFSGEPRQLDGGGWIGFFPDLEGNVLQIVQRPKPLR